MRTSFVFLAVLALTIAAAPVAQSSPILSTSGGDEIDFNVDGAVGWSFTTGPAPEMVNILDAVLDNDFTSTDVRLYNGAGTVLASATVTTADPTETAGLTWYSQTITPVLLPTNTTLYIAQDVQPNLGFYTTTTTPVMADGFTYDGGVQDSGALGGTPTTDPDDGFYNPSYFGPNFDAVPVPEPATALWALPALALACRRRRRSPVA